MAWDLRSATMLHKDIKTRCDAYRPVELNNDNDDGDNNNNNNNRIRTPRFTPLLQLFFVYCWPHVDWVTVQNDEQTGRLWRFGRRSKNVQRV